MAKGKIIESKETYYISYLNKKNNFKQTDKEFTGVNAYEDAMKWGRANLGNFNSDMVRMKHEKGNTIQGSEWRKGTSIKYKTKKEAQERFDLLKNYPNDYKSLRIEKIGDKSFKDKFNDGYVVRFEYLKSDDKHAKGTTISGKEVGLHLPIEMSVYVPSTKDASVPISKSELNSRVKQVKEYLANLFGGYSSSEVVGGYASNEGALIQEDVVKVISFATKKAYEENKQTLIDKIAEWSTKWSQEAIGFELEGDLYYINQDKIMAKGGNMYFEGGDIEGYENYIVELKKGSETRRVGILAHSQKEAISKAKKMIGNGYTIGAVSRFEKGGKTDCGCGKVKCGCWHYEIGGL